MVKFVQAKKHFQKLYKDKLTVKPLIKILDDVGAEINTYSNIASYTDEPCKISFKPKPDQSDDIQSFNNPIAQQIKIFCDPNLIINKGDKFVIKIVNQDGVERTTYEGITNNKPQIFDSHQEILFTLVEDA